MKERKHSNPDDRPTERAMTTERADLTSRVLPQMTLGTGAAGTPTAAPPPLSQSQSGSMSGSPTPSERAAARFGLGGKNAIVTGGAGDLGSAASRALLEHGLAGLAVFDLMAPEAAEPRVAALRAEFPGAAVAFFRVDVTDEDAVGRAVRAAEEGFREAARARGRTGRTRREGGGGEGGVGVGAGVGAGGREGQTREEEEEEEEEEPDAVGVDILLNFAGMVSCAHAVDLTAADWNRVLGVNLVGAAVVSGAAARAMMARGGRGGSIVLVASISAHRVNHPQPQAAYNASKAGVRALARSLAAEWAAAGVRVNSVSPGYMDTVLNEGGGLAGARRAWAARCPTGRMGLPDELSGAVVLLASRAGSYITGADLLIDGGQTLLM